MNMKQWIVIASSLILAFCLCSEDRDTNPVGSGDGGSSGVVTDDFTGKWELIELDQTYYDTVGNEIENPFAIEWDQTNYDTVGNEIENPFAMEDFDAYMDLQEASFTLYMPKDTCIIIDGPNEYTLTDNKMSYEFMGFMPMEQDLEMKDGNLVITTAMPMQDFVTGEVLSTMVTIATYKPYEGALPQSSWPTNTCPAPEMF